MKIVAYFSLFFSIFLISCDPDSDSNDFTAQINLAPMFGETAFNMETTYENGDGVDLLFTSFKYYMNHIELIHEDGSIHELEEVALMDLSTVSTTIISGKLKKGNYVGLRFGLGLDPGFNSMDPTSFAPSHPLSTGQNMHWSWAMKYKFSLIEGKFDDTNDGLANQNFAWHPGLDTLYREVEVSFSNRTLDEGNAQLELVFDLQEIIDGDADLDLMNENFSHSSPENMFIVTKIVDNFAQAFKVD